MTVIGLDDTDSREGGCTTFVAATLAERLAASGSRNSSTVSRRLLVRLNPAVEQKTRGNAALAIHADVPAERALSLARETVEEFREPDANTGVVVAPCEPAAVPTTVATFARTAVRGYHDVEDAVTLAAGESFEIAAWGDGHGRIGALAAVGAWRAFDEWTVERIAYRERERWGTPRTADADAAVAAADAGYPDTWDTVDRGAGEVLCAPRTPCPVLYGVRGEDRDAVSRVDGALRERALGEPLARSATFHTNQGTDAHLRDGRIGELADGYAYRVDGTIASAPETRTGGHVFVPLRAPAEETDASPGTEPEPTLDCVGFEPTKRFRDRVRALKPGDRVTVCGGVARGALKLEKFAVRSLVRTERVVPHCPDCERSMESAGADAGYRCRDCKTTAPGRREQPIERDLDVGWYEVPPRARRHLAKPLVRGGFDAPVHVER